MQANIKKNFNAYKTYMLLSNYIGFKGKETTSLAR
jgi:hypothetical protein